MIKEIFFVDRNGTFHELSGGWEMMLDQAMTLLAGQNVTAADIVVGQIAVVQDGKLKTSISWRPTDKDYRTKLREFLRKQVLEFQVAYLTTYKALKDMETSLLPLPDLNSEKL